MDYGSRDLTGCCRLVKQSDEGLFSAFACLVCSSKSVIALVWEDDAGNGTQANTSSTIGRIQKSVSVRPRRRNCIARRMGELLLVSSREFVHDQVPGSAITPAKRQSLAIRRNRRISCGMRK